MSLRASLGQMTAVDQWFVWRLEWDGVAGKYRKIPCSLSGRTEQGVDYARQWQTFDVAAAAVAQLCAARAGDTSLWYTVGFRLTDDCGYWFLDLDHAVVDGALTEFAAAMVAGFPGAFMEYSSSRTGVHIIGRGAAPPHRSKPPKELASALLPLQLEFYTTERGIAFGLDDVAQGSADTQHDAMVVQLCRDYFPPRAVSDVSARAEWRGPADDDELIRRILASKPSAASVFGDRPSVHKLWAGDAECTSENDMALAAHLAFWTGCDADRMERLMRRSAMVRDKWNTRRPGGTYLTYTIQNAIDVCETVYQEPVRDTAKVDAFYGVPPMPPVTSLVAQPVVSDEQVRQVESFLDAISQCGTVTDMHNVVLPSIRAANVAGPFVSQLANAINKKLDLWGAKLRIGELRALIKPPIVQGSKEVPLWAAKHCYIKATDEFYDTDLGVTVSMQSFIADFGKYMPTKDNGSRENAAEWALHRWCIPVVHDLAYRPDKPPYFDWNGLDYVNRYTSASVPPVATEYTPAGTEGIEAFKALLWDLCARRTDVYMQFLSWLAHNVQRPGTKIRWSPLLKGVQGDGKSLITEVLRAAMGSRNVSVTGNASLTNSGGFNDWAVRAAVNFIEEIHLTGKERHRLYNAMKEFITNNVVSINPKGRVGYDAFNITNHCALSNHNDAIPAERTDRRWFVIFTPWSDLEMMYSYVGLTEEQARVRFAKIDYAYKHCASELRAWFLSVPMDAQFRADGSAPLTAEKSRMFASSRDDADSVAAQIIVEGAVGITPAVLSSACLTNLLRLRSMVEGFEHPRGMAVNHLLTRLGYSQLDKPVKWDGKAHRIWVKDGNLMDNDHIRSQLDGSKGTVTQL